MIYYGKFFELMKEQGKNTTHIRSEKIIGQETLRKLKIGTGVLEEYDYKDTKTVKKVREISVDTKSIEAICVWLECQPSDIMEVIPNTWGNADRLCDILGKVYNYDKETKSWTPLSYEELEEKLVMEKKQ